MDPVISLLIFTMNSIGIKEIDMGNYDYSRGHKK